MSAGKPRAAAVALIVALSALGTRADGALAARAPARRAPLSASLAIDRSAPGAAVPHGFLGLSFEVAAIARLAGYAGTGNLVAFLRSLGAGVVRFGGVTSDFEIAWSEDGAPAPPWATGVLEASELRGLAQLAARSDWHVLLTLNLGHYDPQAAASEAAAANAALGPWLQALEIGNEPDSYAQHGLREEPWTPSQYDEQISAYRGAIEAAAPGLALAGPDTSSSQAFESWGLGEAIDQTPALLTGHFYPMGCAESPPPSIERLLSPTVRQREVHALRRYLGIAQNSEIPFRMDETNSVSCGGVSGISNTFASALWAVADVSQAMAMGAAGINLEGNPVNCEGYTPLCAPTSEDLADGQFSAQPEWYALLLLRALIGERPLPSAVRAPAHSDLFASTFLAPDGALHVVFVDDDPPGSRALTLHIELGSGWPSRGASASVLSLTAPSPEALTGVRLGGREVQRDGTYAQPAKLPVVPARHGSVTLRIAPSSAALISISRG